MPDSKQLTDQEIRNSLPEKTRDIYTKYMESFYFLQPRKRRQANQIVLMNNLQRGDENISSTLLLTLFTRTMANLYDDKMQIKFVPNEEIEQKQIDSLNILAQNDYQQMNMKQLDYDWTWDTLFFGRGYMETLRFDVERKIMQPHVINPLSFGYDPFFDNPQDWRYYWKWITKSSTDINRLIKAGIITSIKDASEIPSGIDPYLWNYKVIRERAKFVTPQASDTFNGDIHQILEFFGYNKDGEKCIYWVDRDFSKLLYYEVLDLRDGEDIIGPGNQVVKTSSKWPIVVKEAFREPHSSVVFSVADLLEDKHRARSVLLNLAFLAAKDKANPLYQYNPDKVRDVTQLFSRQIYQHIPVDDVTNAIAPLNTDTALDPSLQAFMNMLNQEASDPVGANIQQEQQKKGKQTATEAAIQQQLSDLAQSLQSKVMQFGLEDFWSAWYHRYKRFTKEGDEKIATVVGVKGVTFEKIDLGSIRTKYPPGVLIFSAKEAEYKDLVDRRDYMEMLPIFQSTFTPDGMRNFYKYVLMPKFNSLDPATIDVLFPDSIDEIKATEENEIMNQGQMPQVLPTDNHEQHLMVHRMAKNSWEKWVHIQWHEEMLSMQKQQEQQMMQQQQAGLQAPSGPSGQAGQQSQPGQMGGKPAVPPEPIQPQVGVAKQNPKEAASSLRQETLSNIQSNQ
jgi:hypothetical protein